MGGGGARAASIQAGVQGRRCGSRCNSHPQHRAAPRPHHLRAREVAEAGVSARHVRCSPGASRRAALVCTPAAPQRGWSQRGAAQEAPPHPTHPPTSSIRPYSCASVVSKYLLRLHRQRGWRGWWAGGAAHGRGGWHQPFPKPAATLRHASTLRCLCPCAAPEVCGHLVKGLARGLAEDRVHVVADAQQLARLAVDVRGLRRVCGFEV